MVLATPYLNFTIDVQQNIMQQFAEQLGIEVYDNQMLLDTSLGKGFIRFHSFLGQLELYYFNCFINPAIKVNSFNPPDSDWLLLNINLAANANIKTVNNLPIKLQKHLPSGILFYTPQTSVENVNPAGNIIEMVLIRFPKSFLTTYLSKELSIIPKTKNALIYEDLDSQSEYLLSNALHQEHNLLKRHGALLGFLSIFIEKLKQREPRKKYAQLHPDDVQGLFLAAAQLRNPTAQNVPNIEQLAQLANMSMTKFKTCFKQMFGSPPMKYHQKIKMNYAQLELQKGIKSISEVSYELGYSHPSKFTNAYKNAFNILPSASLHSAF